MNWEISPTSGWGLLGLNLAYHAELSLQWVPVPLYPPSATEWIQSDQKSTLEQIFARELDFRKLLNQQPEDFYYCEFPVLHALGNGIIRPQLLERIVGTTNLALIVIENTSLDSQAVTAAKKYGLLLAGSSWNTKILRKNGIQNVETFLQAIDLSLFRPPPKRVDTGELFMIFSGGKLEYRKGQDILIAAFRNFQKRRPNAMLVTAWHNSWPTSMHGLDRQGYVSGLPRVDPNGRLGIVEWLDKNEVPPTRCFDIGLVPNHLLPEVYAQADVAVFPNRCEGGTNLVAMECMACGIPTVLSANTGHLDLIDEEHCFPLTRQTPIEPSLNLTGTEDWGESSVDELEELLERIYTEQTLAVKRGVAAAQFMRDWSWNDRIEKLTCYLEKPL